MSKYTASTILKNPIHFVSFGFGSGLAPFAPGTFGTAMAIPFYYYWLQYLPGFNYSIILLAAFFAGIFFCQYTIEYLELEDPPGVVWDEIVAYWLTMAWVPGEIIWIILGFVIFRIFDIAKPWPINIMDKNIKGGLGIMLDDVMAGVYSSLTLYSIYCIVHTFF